MFLGAIILLANLFSPILSAPEEDLITEPLPGNIQFIVNFKQYAGYLQASRTHHLFYWLLILNSKICTYLTYECIIRMSRN